MKIIQFIMMGLAILYLVFAGFTAVVGMFADGGTIWERALISGIHPVGAIALLVLVYTPRGTYNWTTWVAVALLLLSIAGDMAAYVAISMGTIKGGTPGWPWRSSSFRGWESSTRLPRGSEPAQPRASVWPDSLRHHPPQHQPFRGLTKQNKALRQVQT
jgi:hypothetical protein